MEAVLHAQYCAWITGYDVQVTLDGKSATRWRTKDSEIGLHLQLATCQRQSAGGIASLWVKITRPGRLWTMGQIDPKLSHHFDSILGQLNPGRIGAIWPAFMAPVFLLWVSRSPARTYGFRLRFLIPVGMAIALLDCHQRSVVNPNPKNRLLTMNTVFSFSCSDA